MVFSQFEATKKQITDFDKALRWFRVNNPRSLYGFIRLNYDRKTSREIYKRRSWIFEPRHNCMSFSGFAINYVADNRYGL